MIKLKIEIKSRDGNIETNNNIPTIKVINDDGDDDDDKLIMTKIMTIIIYEYY